MQPNIAATDPNASEDLQREIRASLAAVTGGIAPDDYVNAWWDWYLHLAAEPQQQVNISKSAADSAVDMWNFALSAATGQSLEPAPADKRFSGAAWNQWPYNVYAHAYSSWSNWWQQAISSVPSVAPKNAQLMEFMGKQIMEAASPANHLSTNPELLELTRAESGANLVRGLQNFLEDAQHAIKPDGAESKSTKFVVGRDLAVTPGKVVLRNDLIELIQYSPSTKSVYAEPILITPAWIMKYYILDLSPANSLVRYLVERGHTVFMISWKNPSQADRNLGMDDYLETGVMDALDAVGATAVLAKRGDKRLASMTLLAAQADFSEPGELSLFISPSQLAMLEAVMNKAGVLSSEKMAGSFALLRSRDLLWTPAVNNYVKGKRDDPNDLMAWNADGTRMPWRMHTEYLNKLYLQNELARGEFAVRGKGVKLPMFIVGTETDHVAPWKSAYKLRGLTRSTDYTFLLTSGGHNAGIVSGPVHPKRRHRLLTWSNASSKLTPDEWLEKAPLHAGSWWPAWAHWLEQRSKPKRVAPPPMGNAAKGLRPLEAAPGSYVHQK